MNCALTRSFGGARLLAPHRLPDDLLISRAVANVARALARDPSRQNPAHNFIERVHQKASLTIGGSINDLDRRLQTVLDSPPTTRPTDVLHTIALMTSGKCDLFCEQCYTDQEAHQGEWRVFESAIRQGHEHGAKAVYIAGEGEPLLDDHIGKIILLATKLGMEILIFSNGLQFCHETHGYRSRRGKIMRDGAGFLRRLCMRRQYDAKSFAQWLGDHPVHLYLKMHSANRTVNSRLCGLIGRKLDYTYEMVEFNGHQMDVPTPLLQLPEWGFPIERLGFDAMVVKENAYDILTTIGPWSQAMGYALYAEPFIPSGRILGDPSPSPEQLNLLRQAKYLVRQDCSLNKVLGKVVVWSRGFVSPILAFTWRQLQGRPSLTYDPAKGFMEQRDCHLLFQRIRYEAGCPCAMGSQSLERMLDEYAPRQQKK